MNWLKILAFGTMLLTSAGATPFDRQPAMYPAVVDQPGNGSEISVLTYNIKGLPWPVAWGRPDAFHQMADQLRLLRSGNQAPSIVVLQESFTSAAKQLGREAGYRYVIDGPSAEMPGTTDPAPHDEHFVSAKRWWLGETEGKFLDSGLQILSDYPITRIKRIAFPAVACAGYDCLANKGALMVTIDIPGAPSPIDVVTTHLNSRHASYTDDETSLHAYRRQLAVLSQFIRDNHDSKHPLIVAGDFNMGSDPGRRDGLANAVKTGWGVREPVLSAYDAYVRQGGRLNDDAAYSRRRARDWEFFASGVDGRLKLSGIVVPFGGHDQGRMLSDHVGYVAQFRLSGHAAGPGKMITTPA